MDKGKSILDKLKRKSKLTGISNQQLLLLICQEEFLRRLSMSEYKNNFVLKGGLFIYLLTEFKSRVTIDMDFLLRNQSNSMDEIINSIKEIINIETENDFIVFEVLGANPIIVEKKYPGMSIRMVGKIANTKTPVNIDVGIGDIIVPEAEKRFMKAQLEEFNDVEVNTYSLESAVAEKLDAILQRFELTSRMKDFYDIWYLTKNFDFEGSTISKAIKETLKNRGTLYEEDSIDRITRLADNEITLTRWNIYNKKMKLHLEFDECTSMIEIFFKPVFEALIFDQPFNRKWISDEQRWRG